MAVIPSQIWWTTPGTWVTTWCCPWNTATEQSEATREVRYGSLGHGLPSIRPSARPLLSFFLQQPHHSGAGAGNVTWYPAVNEAQQGRCIDIVRYGVQTVGRGRTLRQGSPSCRHKHGHSMWRKPCGPLLCSTVYRLPYPNELVCF